MQFFTPFPSSIKEIKTVHFFICSLLFQSLKQNGSALWSSKCIGKQIAYMGNTTPHWPDKSQAQGALPCAPTISVRRVCCATINGSFKRKKQDENALDSRHSYTNFPSLCASHPSLRPRKYLAKWIRWLELMIDHCRMVAKGWAKIEKTDDHCGFN